MNMKAKKEVPSLVDLCVWKAISHVSRLGNVAGVDLYLLESILTHCTADQLAHIEKSSEGADLSPVTDKLWKKFYEKQFGVESTNGVVKKMRDMKKSFKWRLLYEAKSKQQDEAEEKSLDRIKQLYQKEDARKQSRQVQICTKVPPGTKRSFFGGSYSGPGHNLSHMKNNLMKKAKMECLNSNEVRNLAAMKNNAIKKNPIVSRSMKPVGISRSMKPVGISRSMKPVGISRSMKPVGIHRNDNASSSNQFKPKERRF